MEEGKRKREGEGERERKRERERGKEGKERMTEDMKHGGSIVLPPSPPPILMQIQGG